jgi:hypothetical protein
MDSIYSHSAAGALEVARTVVKELEENNKVNTLQKAIIVLYHEQVYRIHNVTKYEIHMYPLSSVAYYDTRAKKYWHIGNITSLNESDKDPEFMMLLDQIIHNKPQPFYYAILQMPRYADQQQFFVAQLGTPYVPE